MNTLASFLSAIALGLFLCAPVSAQQTPQAHAEAAQNLLRDTCVAFERTRVAKDTNDFSHLKDSDWMNAAYCQGIIQGFELGANHTVNVLEEPKRLEIFSAQHTDRQIAKAVVTFIDEHPDQTDSRTILLGALKKEGAAVLLGPVRIQELTPDCPKDVKDMPPGGCNLRMGPDAK